jgi:predicted PurR-regulated permease PerM
VEEHRNEPLGGQRQLDNRPINWPFVLRTTARWALVIGAIYIITRILWSAGASTLPFIIGLVLAYLLLPIVKRLDRYMPRWASITAVYLFGLALFEVVLIFVVPPAASQIEQFVGNIPTWFQQGNDFVNRQILEFNRTASDEVRAQVEQQVRNVQQTIQRNATTYAQRAGEFVLNSVLGIFATITFLLGFLVIPFFLFYILVDTNKLPGAINTLLHPRIRKDFWNIWNIVDGTMGQYIRGQLILGLIIGAASFIGLTVLNLLGFEVRYTVLLAIIAGIGELIPVIGPILSAIPAVIVAFGGGTESVIGVVILYVLIQQLENQILVPRIVGNTLRLHAAILMALLVIAGAVGGLGLVILSAPLAAIGRDVFVYLHRRLREPPQPPELAIAGITVEDKQPEPVKEKQPRRLLKGSKS